MNYYNNFNQQEPQVAVSGDINALIRPTMLKVYNWMAMGLMVSAIVSLLVLKTPALFMFAAKSYLFFLFAEFAMVIGFGAMMKRAKSSTLIGMFFAFAAMNGLTLGVILALYTASSVASVFFVTAGMFGALSAYGYITKRDLSMVGKIAFMALVGIIIASIINIFVASGSLNWAITIFGIGIFAALTAYDTQKIKALAFTAFNDEEMMKKVAVAGALTLYLDFINLFIFLLRLFGKRD